MTKLYICNDCDYRGDEDLWNQNTVEYLGSSKPWRQEKGITSISKSYATTGEAWFFCPGCNGPRYACPDDIDIVQSSVVNNREVKFLLEESW